MPFSCRSTDYRSGAAAKHVRLHAHTRARASCQRASRTYDGLQRLHLRLPDARGGRRRRRIVLVRRVVKLVVGQVRLAGLRHAYALFYLLVHYRTPLTSVVQCGNGSVTTEQNYNQKSELHAANLLCTYRYETLDRDSSIDLSLSSVIVRTYRPT